VTPRLPPVNGNTRAERRALRLQHARGAQALSGETPSGDTSLGNGVNDTAAAGQETGSVGERIWFLPAGAARGERNQHRLRGWAIAVSAAILLWGVIALVVWSLASLF